MATPKKLDQQLEVLDENTALKSKQIQQSMRKLEAATSKSAKKRKQIQQVNAEIKLLNTTLANAKKAKSRRQKPAETSEADLNVNELTAKIDVNELTSKIETALEAQLLTATKSIGKSMDTFSTSLEGISKHTQDLKRQPAVTISASLSKQLDEIPKSFAVLKDIPKLLKEVGSDEKIRSISHTRLLQELASLKNHHEASNAKQLETNRLSLANHVRKLKKAHSGLKDVAAIMQRKLEDQTSELLKHRIDAIDLSVNTRLTEQNVESQRAHVELQTSWMAYAKDNQSQAHLATIHSIEAKLTMLTAANAAQHVPLPQVCYAPPNGFVPSNAVGNAPRQAADVSSHAPAPEVRAPAPAPAPSWQTWTQFQISQWLVNEGCSALEKALYPVPGVEGGGPFNIVHGRQLAHLDDSALQSLGAPDDVSLTISKRTFVEAFRLLTSAQR